MSSSKGSTAGGRSSSYVRVPGGGPSGEPPVKPTAAPPAQPAAAADVGADLKAVMAGTATEAQLARVASELGHLKGLVDRGVIKLPAGAKAEVTKAAKAVQAAPKGKEKAAAKAALRGTAERGARAKELRAGKAGRTDALAHLRSINQKSTSLAPAAIDAAVGTLRKLSVADLKYVQKRFLGVNLGGSSKKQMLHFLAKKIHDARESRDRGRDIMNM